MKHSKLVITIISIVVVLGLSKCQETSPNVKEEHINDKESEFSDDFVDPDIELLEIESELDDLEAANLEVGSLLGDTYAYDSNKESEQENDFLKFLEFVKQGKEIPSDLKVRVTRSEPNKTLVTTLVMNHSDFIKEKFRVKRY